LFITTVKVTAPDNGCLDKTLLSLDMLDFASSTSALEGKKTSFPELVISLLRFRAFCQFST
jgi:hypothetical protein